MSTDFYKGIGRRIAAFRKLEGLTAQQLADRVPDLTRGGLAKIESGVRAVLPVELIVNIAFALGVPPNAIIFPLGHPKLTMTFNGEEAMMVNLYSWITGPPPTPLSAERYSGPWHGAQLVEVARSIASLMDELEERWGMNGEEAVTEEEKAAYRETGNRLSNAIGMAGYLGLELVQGKRSKAADDGND